ncbi:MAG TPA: tryptophan synthase subunit beta, partial [Cycloclasticus sp.]|nr:tryptophan synthase subunit beta [Cycloclasticus sp.]
MPTSNQSKQSAVKNYDLPDENGHFGPYGGLFVAETLMESIEELNAAYAKYMQDPEFLA